MVKYVALLLGFVLVAPSVSAQSPSSGWSQSFGLTPIPPSSRSIVQFGTGICWIEGNEIRTHLAEGSLGTLALPDGAEELLELRGLNNVLYLRSAKMVDGQQTYLYHRYAGGSWEVISRAVFTSGSFARIRDAVWTYDGGGVRQLVGGQWEPLPGLPQAAVTAVTGSSTDAYIAFASGTVMHYNGSTSTALFSLNGGATALEKVGADLYMIGPFTDAGGIATADGFARWNGQQLVAPAPGVTPTQLASLAGKLHVVGQREGDAAPYVFRLDGESWAYVGQGQRVRAAVAQTGERFKSDGERLLVVGDLTYESSGQHTAYQVGIWDGTQWQMRLPYAHQSGLNGPVYGMVAGAEGVYVGGGFVNAGGNPDADRLARWDGTAWNPVGGGLNGGIVEAIDFQGTSVVVGGSFVDAGGNPNADKVARWDGSRWNALGSGLNGTVFTLLVDGDRIYAGGSLQDVAGNPSADMIAQWDGTQWQPMGLGFNGPVDDFALFQGILYAAGGFTNVGGNPQADYVVRWDGTQWQPVGSVPEGTGVADLMVFEGSLYATGYLRNVEGNPEAIGVARWDGSEWRTAGVGLPSAGLSMEVYNGLLYVGSLPSFSEFSGVYVLAGGRWNLVGRTRNRVYGLGAFGGKLYAGGTFSSVDGTPSSYFAAYADPALGLSSEEESAVPEGLQIRAFGAKHVEILSASGEVRVDLYDVLGRNIAGLYKGQVMGGRLRVALPSGLSHGVYFVHAQDEAGDATLPVVAR